MTVQKKSAKGLLMVGELGDGTYELHDQVDWSQEAKGALQTIYIDGTFMNEITLSEIRQKLNNLKFRKGDGKKGSRNFGSVRGWKSVSKITLKA